MSKSASATNGKRETRAASVADAALSTLRQLIGDQRRIFYVVRKVGRGGLSRSVDYVVFIPQPEGEMQQHYLSSLMAKALRYRLGANGLLCNEPFEPVYQLSRLLFAGDGRHLSSERI
jgi:hypothetical protein